MTVWAIGLALLSVALSAAEGQQTFELRGRIEPAPATARVTIQGANHSHSAEMQTLGGKFKFKKLPPGAYVVSVFVQGSGMTRRSVDVTATPAAGKGYVEIVIPLSAATTSMPRARARNTVSIAELSIPEKARKEYAEAQKMSRKGDTAGAVAHLEKAVEIAPKYSAPWFDLGMIALRVKDWPRAETCLKKALELRQGSVRIMLSLASAIASQGRLQDAYLVYRQAVDRMPSSAEANYQTGIICLFLGKEQEAAEYLRAVKKVDPAYYSSPQLPLAELCIRKGDKACARAELEEFLTYHPDAPEAGKVRAELAKLN